MMNPDSPRVFCVVVRFERRGFTPSPGAPDYLRRSHNWVSLLGIAPLTERRVPSLRLSRRSLLYWLQAFSCRHYRVSSPAGILPTTVAPDSWHLASTSGGRRITHLHQVPSHVSDTAVADHRVERFH